MFTLHGNGSCQCKTASPPLSSLLVNVRIEEFVFLAAAIDHTHVDCCSITWYIVNCTLI